MGTTLGRYDEISCEVKMWQLWVPLQIGLGELCHLLCRLLTLWGAELGMLWWKVWRSTYYIYRCRQNHMFCCPCITSKPPQSVWAMSSLLVDQQSGGGLPAGWSSVGERPRDPSAIGQSQYRSQGKAVLASSKLLNRACFIVNKIKSFFSGHVHVATSPSIILLSLC